MSEATLAGEKASAASTDAATAKTKAGEAAASVVLAVGSATTATTKAGEAATSAVAAKKSETAASASVIAAAGSASAADVAVAGLTADVAAVVDAAVNTTLAASTVLQAKAGTAEAELELVALDDTGAYVASQARISADNILLDGSVTATSIKANSITADRLRADVRNWDPLWAGSRTVTTAWSTFSLLDEITNFQWIMVCVAFRISNNDPTKSRYLMEMFSAANPNEQASGSDLVDDRRGNDDVFFERVNDTSIRLKTETGGVRIASIWGVRNPGAGYTATTIDGGGGTTTTDIDSISRLGTSAPTKPTGGTSTENHTPTDWSRSVLVSTATQNTYVSARTRTYVNGVFTSATAWGPVILSQPKTGGDDDIDSISRLGTSAPTKPTGGTSTENHTPTDWSRSALTATTTQNVYRSTRTRTYVDGTFISATSWSTPTLFIAKTGGLPTPNRPTSTTSQLETTATNVSGGAFCTFQYDDNSSFSSPATAYDTAKSNVHAVFWTPPSGTTYVRARLTTGTRDTGSKSAWSPTQTYGAAEVTTTTDNDAVYRRGTSTPSTPTGGESTLAHTPTNWSRNGSLTATTTQNVYASSRVRTYVDGVFTSATAWSTPTLWRAKTGGSTPTTTINTDGISRRGTSAPSKPTGGTSTVAHTPSGWSRSILLPTATQNVYVSARTRTYVNGVFTSATAWGPVILSQSKTGGDDDTTTTNTDTISRYGTFTPVTPSGGTSTERHTPTSWFRLSLTATATQNVYQASRTRTYVDGTFTSATAWGNVMLTQRRTGARGRRGLQIPVPAIAGERYTDAGTGLNSIKLSGGLSTDPNGGALTCRFRLVSGAPCTLDAEFDVVYQIAEEVLVLTDAATSIGPGEYVFEISVSNGFSSATAQVTVAALNSSPGGR